MNKEKLLQELKEAEKFNPDFTDGLSTEQVEQRKKEELVNHTAKKVTKSYWKIIKDNFFSFFNILLFIVAIIMLSAKVYNPKYYGFLAILLVNDAIGLVTDIRARKLVDKLRLITDPRVNVIRNGKEEEIHINEIVYEDVVILRPGEQICADAVVVEGELKADESLLTGESVAISKSVGDEVLSGSYVKSGKAHVKVIRVGSANYAEDIQNKAKEFSRPKSELKRSCLKIFLITGICSIVLGLGMTITYLVEKFGMGEDLSYYDFAKSLGGSMVAMIPSGLYLLVSLALAKGVLALTKKHMNVQELYCIEMLARVDVVCFDKTGTLTDGTIRVKDILTCDKYSKEEISDVLASLVNATKDENATAKAVTLAYSKGSYEATAVVPFDSDYKYSAASFGNKGTFIMGAFGFIPQKPVNSMDNEIDSLSKEGYRVLAIYHNDKSIEKGKIPTDNTLIGLIYFSDHIKDDAKPNIEWFQKNGVDIKIISGDNPVTVSQIAAEVGVKNADNYVSMDQVKDEDIPALIKTCSVFGRVKPEQKAIIVEALQNEGHKVAMTGDGVNDIIALKKADCSIAMASGASAARNVAHLVSMDNDFSKLPDVVAEGRRVINNLQRSSSLFLGKTIFAVILSFVFLISGWCGGMKYPFSTTNLFVWELCSIGLAGFFLALQPSKERLSGSFMKNTLATSVPSGLVEALCVLIFFGAYLIDPSFMSKEAAITCSTIVFTLVSYLVLFRICVPFDKYRAIVAVGLFVLGGLCFLADYLIPGKTNSETGLVSSLYLDLNYGVMTWRLALFMAGSFLALAFVYVLIDCYVRKRITHIKIFGKKDE